MAKSHHFDPSTSHPSVIEFEGLGKCFFSLGPVRDPRKGEFYLSGSIVMAYKAPEKLKQKFRIVVPTHKAVPVSSWARGETILTARVEK